METRAWMFARELAKRGDLKISLAVHSSTLPSQLLAGGVHLAVSHEPLKDVRQSVGKVVSRTPGFPGLRVESWDWSLLWKLPLLAVARIAGRPDPLQGAKQSHAHVYGTFGVNRVSAEVVRWAASQDKPSILFIAHDHDLDERIVSDPGFVDSYGEPSAVRLAVLKEATVIIAQTPWQQETLRSRFGREAVLIENPIDPQPWTVEPSNVESNSKPCVLWIGRAERSPKRPQKCIELACRLPQLQFVMILNPRDPEVESEIRATAAPNVQIVSRVPFEQMPAQMRSARVLLNTSEAEGFPNTFLQATLSRLPIVSLEVASQFLTDVGTGMCCHGDVDLAARQIQSYWDHPPTAEHWNTATNWVLEHHGAARQAEKLAGLVHRLSAKSKAGEQS